MSSRKPEETYTCNLALPHAQPIREGLREPGPELPSTSSPMQGSSTVVLPTLAKTDLGRSRYASIFDAEYRTDNFMMFGYKIAMCSRPGRHNWAECPFAHPTENARRRDPRLFSYSCIECPLYRNAGYCPKGDTCEHSHGLFESRLHPDSYRTEACCDGPNCKRKVCFFYHDEKEKRVSTGLHDARAQLTAEFGESVLTMRGDALRTVANQFLVSSPTCSSVISSLSTSLSVSPCHTQSIRHPFSAMSDTQLTSASNEASTGDLASLLGVQSVRTWNNSDTCLAHETVAPCLKGLNKNKHIIRELAKELNMRPDSLMQSLRVASLQGELTPHSSASCAAHGTFNQTIERILSDIANAEEFSTDKLRGWLLRQDTGSKSTPSAQSMWQKQASVQKRGEMGMIFSCPVDPVTPAGAHENSSAQSLDSQLIRHEHRAAYPSACKSCETEATSWRDAACMRLEHQGVHGSSKGSEQRSFWPHYKPKRRGKTCSQDHRW